MEQIFKLLKMFLDRVKATQNLKADKKYTVFPIMTNIQVKMLSEVGLSLTDANTDNI